MISTRWPHSVTALPRRRDEFGGPVFLEGKADEQQADRAHLWHHLIQHKPFETNDPRVIVEGKGMRVWDALGKEHLDAVSGGVWTVNVGYGR